MLRRPIRQCARAPNVFLKRRAHETAPPRIARVFSFDTSNVSFAEDNRTSIFLIWYGDELARSVPHAARPANFWQSTYQANAAEGSGSGHLKGDRNYITEIENELNEILHGLFLDNLETNAFRRGAEPRNLYRRIIEQQQTGSWRSWGRCRRRLREIREDVIRPVEH